MIERLAGGSAHVIGAKSGGLVTIELAAQRPYLVKSIILASTPLDPPQPQNWLAHMEKHGMRSWARMTCRRASAAGCRRAASIGGWI